MGEAPDDDAPTEYTPTELSAASLGRTLAACLTHVAVAVGIGMGFVVGLTAAIITYLAKLPRRLTPGRITALAVAGSLVVVAVAAGIAVLHLRGEPAAPAVSQEELVRTTIENFDIAVQNGDLSTLRGITCGATRDNYVRYNEKAWSDTHSRVAAAKQYPVVASIDQVVINGDHAEANVTTFIANAPQTRSTRSFDLEFRDDQWKICQAPAS